jgi:phage FluMu gp28-like protein
MTRAARQLGRAKTKAPDTFFLPFQKSWIEDNSRLKLMEKSRQIGMSWAASYRTVRTTSSTENRLDSWISSRDEIQAGLFLRDCKAFAALLNVGAQDLGEKMLEESKHSAFVLRFANNCNINSMSSNPDAQAGKRGGRILDEFALHPDPRKLYSIAYPGITWGGSLEILSTHRGSGNFFNRLIEEVRYKGNPKGFSLHTVTLQDALDQGFLAKLQAKLPEGDARIDMDEAQYFDFIRAGCADDETFQQEYMCIAADDASAFLSYELIDTCQYHANEDWELPAAQLGRSLYLGVDVGREKDLTVMWLMEPLGGVMHTRRIVTLQGTPFSEQEAVLDELMQLGVRRVCIDETGLGRQFAERAAQRYGKYRAEGVTFTGPVKEELAYPVRAAFEDRSLRVPDSADVRADLRGIRKETTSSGNIRFSGERSDRGHCDRFWALALSMYASRMSAAPAYGETIRPRENPDRPRISPTKGVLI